MLCLVDQLCPTLCDPMDCTMEFSRLEYWSGLPCPPPGDLPNPRIEPRSPTLQTASLAAQPPGKLKNTEVGSLSLLQQIFPTQESNRGLLHCRWIPYQPSYQGSPTKYLLLCQFLAYTQGSFRITKLYPYNKVLWWLNSKESSCQCRKQGFHPWVGKNPWRRKWLPTPVFLPGKSHGERNLVGYSPWQSVGHYLAAKRQ